MFLSMAPCVRQSSLKAVLVSGKLAKNRQNMASASALKHPGVAKNAAGKIFWHYSDEQKVILCWGIPWE